MHRCTKGRVQEGETFHKVLIILDILILQVPERTPKESCKDVPKETCKEVPVEKERQVAKKVCEKKPW